LNGLENRLPLPAVIIAAGLPMPQMIAAARVEGGPHSPVYDYRASKEDEA
jgi:hypothetical protein